MSTLALRWLFAALCGVFFIAIGGVAGWEWVRFRRGESALSPRHFRWRALSALTWMLVLAAFFVATVWLWPQSGADKESLKRTAMVLLGGMTLMILAFVLMAVDVFWTVQVGRRAKLRRTRQGQESLQRELDRVQRSKAQQNGGADGTS